MAALSQGADRRRFRRLPIKLTGSAVASQQEAFACHSADISPGGVSVLSSVAVPPGKRVVLQFEQLGRLVGFVRQSTKIGFGVALHATTDERETLTAKLTWLANKTPLALSDLRQSARFVPATRETHLRLVDGSVHAAQIGDLSQSGALLATRSAIAEGSLVEVENRPSRVVRIVKGGVGVAFLKPMEATELDWRLEQRVAGAICSARAQT